MSENYTAAHIQILDAGQAAHRWFWAEAGLLATQYRRPEEWIRRGLLACETVGVSHDYFVDRYLKKQPIPFHPGVDDAMHASWDGGNAKISLGERPNGDFAGEGISTPHPAFSIGKMALPFGLNSISQPGD